MTQATILRYLAPKPSSKDAVPPGENKAAQTDAQNVYLASMELEELQEHPGKGQSQSMSDLVGRTNDVSRPAVAPRTQITRVTASHVGDIKRLTSTTLPMRYPDTFFSEVTTDQTVGDLARVALFQGSPIGWIRCRLEPVNTSAQSPHTINECQMYIQALCLLAPYRQRGLATRLLQEVTSPDILRKYGVTSIYAHVWEHNEDALLWYEKRGFSRILLLDQYYRRLRPSGAWIVRKDPL